MASSSTAFWPRLVVGSILFFAIFTSNLLQQPLSAVYNFLYSSSFYKFSGFETIETILCYSIIETIYICKLKANPHLRIDKRGPARQESESSKPKLPKMRRPSRRLGEMITYATPLLAMDFVMIKKFAGVPVGAIRETGGYPPVDPSQYEFIKPTFLLPTVHNFRLDSPLQLQRALPPDPPTSRRLVLELLIAFFIYDTLFFWIHVAFHRIKPLARIHQPHHTHAEINPQITNKLSIGERLSLVLLANFSLNIIGSHVLTRTVFVPFFVYLLIEIHSGLDLPWGYDKIMPFGMGAGSTVHAMHHRIGEGAYAPFFCWWDKGYEWVMSRQTIPQDVKDMSKRI
jgi:cholesterol 25-hydroxylase